MYIGTYLQPYAAYINIPIIVMFALIQIITKYFVHIYTNTIGRL